MVCIYLASRQQSYLGDLLLGLPQPLLTAGILRVQLQSALEALQTAVVLLQRHLDQSAAMVRLHVRRVQLQRLLDVVQRAAGVHQLAQRRRAVAVERRVARVATDRLVVLPDGRGEIALHEQRVPALLRLEGLRSTENRGNTSSGLR